MYQPPGFDPLPPPTAMAFVGPWVNRHTIGTKRLRICCCFHYVGMVATAAIAQGCELINVYTQLCHAVKLMSIYGKGQDWPAPCMVMTI